MQCCVLCKGKLKIVNELGNFPLGFPINKQDTSKKIWTQKLTLAICKRCFLVQTKHKIPSQKLEHENLYRSKTLKIVSSHDKTFLKKIKPFIKISKNSKILEIGCGDGSLLEEFKAKGFENVIGIEPSPHLDKKNDVKVINGFFDKKIAALLRKEKEVPDLIISNYVIELIPNLKEFFKNISKLMKNESFVVFEVPYFNDNVKKLRIDAFPHLRCNWFTINSLVYAFKNNGIEVIYIDHDKNYRGGIIRIIGKKTNQKLTINSNLDKRLKKEKNELTTQFFKNFNDELDCAKKNILLNFKKLPTQLPVCGYGGGLKASILLNWLNLTHNNIKFVVDIDSNKHDKLIAIANIPIKPIKKLKKRKIIVIMLALDHQKEILQFLKHELKSGSLIVNLLPKFKISKSYPYPYLFPIPLPFPHPSP